MKEKCPKCGKLALVVIDVMSATEKVTLHCTACCYTEKRTYLEHDEKQKPRQQTLTKY